MKKSGFRFAFTILSVIFIFFVLSFFLYIRFERLQYPYLSDTKDSFLGDENISISEKSNIYQIIKRELKNGNTLQESSIPEQETMVFPKGIHIGQAVSYQSLGSLRFAIVQRRNMNIDTDGVPRDYPTVFSGILVNRESEKTWIKYVTVNNEVNDSGYLPINNVFSLWNEDELLYLTAVDSNGAGSGEGFLKAFVSDDYGKTWKVERCFYYTSTDVCKVEIYDKENGYGRYVCLHPREQMDILKEYPLSYDYCNNAFL